MTSPALPMLTALLCADAAALDSDYSRLLQAKDAAIRLALEQLAADLAACPLSEDESATAWALLVAFFARLYRDGETVVSRLPVAIDGIWLDWWYRSQHALGEGSRFRNYTCGVKTRAGEVAVRFIVASAQAASAKRGLLMPLAEQVQYDAEHMTMTLPFVYRQPTGDERARWGRGQAAQRAALQELLSPYVEAVAGAALPSQELLKQARAFVSLQWGDRFLPVGLGPLLEARLERYLLECAGPSTDQQAAEVETLGAWRRIYQGVRASASPLIDALARAAEPESRLFEKRPFVVRTDWLAPVMYVARSLWPTILANTAQLEAWRALFDLSGRIDEGVLERHPTLVVDTRHFEDAFKQAFLASFSDRDAALCRHPDPRRELPGTALPRTRLPGPGALHRDRPAIWYRQSRLPLPGFVRALQLADYDGRTAAPGLAVAGRGWGAVRAYRRPPGCPPGVPAGRAVRRGKAGGNRRLAPHLWWAQRRQAFCCGA